MTAIAGGPAAGRARLSDTPESPAVHRLARSNPVNRLCYAPGGLYSAPSQGGVSMNVLAARSEALCRSNREMLVRTRVLIGRSIRRLNPAFGISGSSDETADQVSVNGHVVASLVRDKLARNELFVLPRSKCWGGPMTGQVCVVCKRLIEDPVELEIQGPDGPVFAHVACYDIWHTGSKAFSK